MSAGHRVIEAAGAVCSLALLPRLGTASQHVAGVGPEAATLPAREPGRAGGARAVRRRNFGFRPRRFPSPIELRRLIAELRPDSRLR